MSNRRHTRDEIRDDMRRAANQSRDTADEMAAMFDGCDDPLHPFMPSGEAQPFRDWVDFHDRVCAPLVHAEDDPEAQQAAMRLYRQASPHFIATCLVMARARTAASGETPLRCENCGKAMAEHDALARCWPERSAVGSSAPRAAETAGERAHHLDER